MFVKRHVWFIVVLQSGLITLSLIAAWLLRFEFSLPHSLLLFSALPLLLLFRLVAMYRFNLFHGYWRFTGVSDAEDIVRSVALGSAGFMLSIRYVLGLRSFPLSIYILEALLTTLLLVSVRVASRLAMEAVARNRAEFGRVIIVGAGAAAEALIRELKGSERLVLACVDDDPAKRGARIHGIPVLGEIESLPDLVETFEVNEVFIAIPSLVGSRMRRIIEICQSAHVPFKTIPGMKDLVEGRVTVSQLRPVNVEDLLGRDPVKLDLASVRDRISGRVVMVTGAAGSIGSEICKQVLSYEPSKLICLDQAETPLFYLHGALERHVLKDRIAYKVCDITNGTAIRQLLQEFGVQIIFNAAAYKHVPMMEFNPEEALRNNVFGLLELLHAAEAAQCEHFLQISSDKAVNPTNVMGATKRIGELILASRPSSMNCVAVRFGNVLGSQGSVVPLFQEQIKRDRRVTVTHPEITRYFMTIPEAVSLVLQAFAVGEHGNVLVLNMGEPVKIVDLAKSLIQLSGMPEESVSIAFTGLRPGEKLFEELFYSSESLLPTSHESVYRTESDLMRWATLAAHLGDLKSIASSGTRESLRAKIKDIVPEYDCTSQLNLQAPSAESSAQIGHPLVRAAAAGS